MPCVKQVLSMQEIVENWSWKWLLQSLRNSKTYSDRTLLRNYVLNHLNANIRQRILDDVLSIHFYSLDLSNKLLLLELLGDHSTTCVDLTRNGYAFVEEVFSLYRTLTMNPLNNLSKFGVICRFSASTELKYVLEINSLFYRPLQQMKHLRWVTLQGIGEPLLLLTLGTSCPFLEYLDVSSSLLVDDASMFGLLLEDPESVSILSLEEMTKYNGPINTCCSSLSFLGISGTDVSFVSIILCLHLVPNLYSFGGYIDQGSVSKAIKFLQDAKGVISLKLTNFWDEFISKETTSLLNTVCPPLSFVSTSANSSNSLHFLQSVTSLILDCDFQDFEGWILDLLYARGEALTHLKLNESVNTTLELSSLTEYAPHLKELVAPLHCQEDSTPAKLSQLEKATIAVNSTKCLKNFILCSPSLQHFTVEFDPLPYAETFESINDEFITSVLQAGALKNLSHLSIENCGFGDEGLESILCHCSHLCFIEKLFYWKNLSKKFVTDLKIKIINLNWNLKLVIKEKHGDMTY